MFGTLRSNAGIPPMKNFRFRRRIGITIISWRMPDAAGISGNSRPNIGPILTIRSGTKRQREAISRFFMEACSGACTTLPERALYPAFCTASMIISSETPSDSTSSVLASRLTRAEVTPATFDAARSTFNAHAWQDMPRTV